MDRLPRRVERLIALSLITLASIGGYAVRGSGKHDTPGHRAVVAKATPRKHAVSPTEKKTNTSTKPSFTTTSIMKRANMQPPLTPTGGDYNTAEAAAYNVTNGSSDVAGAETLLRKIKNPTVKVQAEHAVQVGIAEMASNDVTNGSSDVKSAEILLGSITLPDVRSKAQAAIDEGLAELAAWDVTNGNTDVAAAKALEAKITDSKLAGQVALTIKQEQAGNTDGADSTWNNLYGQSDNGWNDLYDQSRSEWDTLYLHTDEYRQQYDQAK